MLIFKKIELSVLEDCRKFLKNENEFSCENTFVNLLVWRNTYNYMYAVKDDILYIKSNEGSKEVFRLPLGEDVEKGIAEILAYTGGKLPDFWSPDGESFRKIPDSFKDTYIITEERDSFDYLYLQKDLAELKGKKYHSKRNHISAFSKQFDWHYEKITPHNSDKVLECAERWYIQAAEKTDKYMLAEKEGIYLMLQNMDLLEITGGAIVVDGKVVAFTLGSALNSYVFNIYVEKALQEFSGAYAVINREFAANELSAFEYINREDDMGLEGLRKAKLSYKPISLVKKYYCTPKENL